MAKNKKTKVPHILKYYRNNTLKYTITKILSLFLLNYELLFC